MTRFTLGVGLLLVLGAVRAAQADPAPADPTLMRDSTSRLATAVLGQVCLLNLGDVAATLAAAAPGGEFGFIETPDDIARALLDGRPGHVRVLRRAGMGAVTLVVRQDGQCAVMAEYADAGAITRYLQAMIERGGLRGAATLMPLDSRVAEGGVFTDYALSPAGWFATILGKRFGGDGTNSLAMVSWASQRSAAGGGVEAVLTVRPPVTQPVRPPAAGQTRP